MSITKSRMGTPLSVPVASQPKTETVIIDSETALAWLEANVKNRPISSTVVERYRRDMAQGRWTFAGDPFRFSTGGNLLDGQHRLAALALVPGINITALVVYGLPDESQYVMDQGRKRQPGQQLALDGIKNPNNIAAMAKLYILWDGGLLFRDNKIGQLITSAEIQDWVAENAETVDFIQQFVHLLRRLDAPPSVSGAAAIRFSEIDPGDCLDFFTKLSQGGEPLGSPINTLDKRLQRHRRNGIAIGARDTLSLFVMAWNAWRDGREMTKFQLPRGGSWTAESFPEPR